jgi:hypothetical protein
MTSSSDVANSGITAGSYDRRHVFVRTEWHEIRPKGVTLLEPSFFEKRGRYLASRIETDLVRERSLPKIARSQNLAPIS